MLKDTEIDLLTRIAWMYYKRHMTQLEIAKKLGMTRQRIQRLLQKAERLGIISINIRNPKSNLLTLEEDLKEKFDLSDAVVVPLNSDYELLKRDVGIAAAQYLTWILNSSDIKKLGVGLGSTLRIMVDNFFPNYERRDLKIFSLVGNLLRNIALNPYSIGEMLSHKLNAQFYNIWAPAVVQNEDRLRVILSEPWIEEVISSAEKSDLFLCGVGTTLGDLTLMKMGFLNEAEYDRLLKKGAVGDLLGRFFDEDGNVIDDEIHSRIVGIDLDRIKGKEIMVVAGGVQKFKILKAVLKSGFVKILITDEETAHKLMKI